MDKRLQLLKDSQRTLCDAYLKGLQAEKNLDIDDPLRLPLRVANAALSNAFFIVNEEVRRMEEGGK